MIACFWIFRKTLLAKLPDIGSAAPAAALAQAEDTKTVKPDQPRKKPGKQSDKPKKPGKILVAGKTAFGVDGCNLSLRSVKNGIAEIDVTKPNMAVTRLAKLRTGSMTRFSTADQQYYVRVSEVGKDFVRISVKKGAEI